MTYISYNRAGFSFLKPAVFFIALFHLNTKKKEGNKTTRLNPVGILPNLPFSPDEKEYLPKYPCLIYSPSIKRCLSVEKGKDIQGMTLAVSAYLNLS